MSLSHEFVKDEHELVEYLLGLLPEARTEQLDEASIVDDEVAFRLQSVENDLVDAYVRGRLDAETRRQFEAVYLASPRRREKVKFAERFARSIDRASPDDRAPASDPRGRHDQTRSAGLQTSAAPVPTGWKFAWQVPIAALLLLACGGLLVQDIRLRREVTQRQLDRATPAGVAASAPPAARTDGRSADAAAVNTPGQPVSSPELRDQAQNGRPSPATVSVPSLAAVSIVLAPQTRAPGPVVTIAVPPAAERVALELRLESNDFARYDVVLKDPGTDRIVWRSRTVSPRSRHGVSFVPLVVPAGVLEPQHYSLELSGVGASGRGETLGSYAFQIERE